VSSAVVVVEQRETEVVETSETEVLVTESTQLLPLEVGIVGPQGATGATGAQGEPGTPGTADEYEHVQAVPSALWTIAHNLARRPAGITVYDSSGTEIFGSVLYLDDNTVRVAFSAAFSGRAKVV
jgi:hypothetical protein